MTQDTSLEVKVTGSRVSTDVASVLRILSTVCCDGREQFWQAYRCVSPVGAPDYVACLVYQDRHDVLFVPDMQGIPEFTLVYVGCQNSAPQVLVRGVAPQCRIKPPTIHQIFTRHGRQFVEAKLTVAGLDMLRDRKPGIYFPLLLSGKGDDH